MPITITTLMENTSNRAPLCAEHGMSFLVDTGSRRILLDVGDSDGFLRNADALGLDLGTADTLVLSHGHYDHTGGVPALIARGILRLLCVAFKTLVKLAVCILVLFVFGLELHGYFKLFFAFVHPAFFIEYHTLKIMPAAVSFVERIEHALRFLNVARAYKLFDLIERSAAA